MEWKEDEGGRDRERGQQQRRAVLVPLARVAELVQQLKGRLELAAEIAQRQVGSLELVERR